MYYLPLFLGPLPSHLRGSESGGGDEGDGGGGGVGVGGGMSSSRTGTLMMHSTPATPMHIQQHLQNSKGSLEHQNIYSPQPTGKKIQKKIQIVSRIKNLYFYQCTQA